MVESDGICCSEKQLNALITNFLTPKSIIAEQCPTCYYNFITNFCDMTCSPNQTDYVRPDKYITLEDTGREVVAELTYFTHKEFNEDTYNSCKNVQFPSMSDTIMGLLCGPWGSMYCTPERWWTYLGTTANGYSPFEIHYDIKNQTKSDDGSFTYHNPAMTACNIPPKVGEVNVGCQCADCEEACTKEDEAVIEPINEEFFIGNANGYVVIAAAAFGLHCSYLWLYNLDG